MALGDGVVVGGVVGFGRKVGVDCESTAGVWVRIGLRFACVASVPVETELTEEVARNVAVAFR